MWGPEPASGIMLLFVIRTSWWIRRCWVLSVNTTKVTAVEFSKTTAPYSGVSALILCPSNNRIETDNQEYAPLPRWAWTYSLRCVWMSIRAYTSPTGRQWYAYKQRRALSTRRAKHPPFGDLYYTAFNAIRTTHKQSEWWTDPREGLCIFDL